MLSDGGGRCDLHGIKGRSCGRFPFPRIGTAADDDLDQLWTFRRRPSPHLATFSRSHLCSRHDQSEDILACEWVALRASSARERSSSDYSSQSPRRLPLGAAVLRLLLLHPPFLCSRLGRGDREFGAQPKWSSWPIVNGAAIGDLLVVAAGDGGSSSRDNRHRRGKGLGHGAFVRHLLGVDLRTPRLTDTRTLF